MLALPRAWVQYVIEELKALKQRSLAKIYIYISGESGKVLLIRSYLIRDLKGVKA